MASCACTRPTRWSSSVAPSRLTTPSPGMRPRPSMTACANCLPASKSITTFGPYSPGQAVAIKRVGIEGIYLGGWATSAKGSVNEDPGPDLASYPLSQVPDEAAPLVRALLAADRNQYFLRLRMSEEERRQIPDSRLPAVHHRRRRHRPWRRRPRAQPGPALRRSRRARLPYRRPEARREEVRSPGRQGAGAGGRADQAPQRGALPARRHAGARGSSSPAPTPRRPPSSTAAATSATIASSSAPPTPTSPTTRRPSWRSCASSTAKGVPEINGHLMYRITDDTYAAADEWLEKNGLVRRDRRGDQDAAEPQHRGHQRGSRPGRHPPARPLADGSQPEDLRRSRCRRHGLPHRRGCGAADDRGGMARLRRAVVLRRGPAEGPGHGLQHHLELRYRPHPGRLLPGQGRHPLRHRQVPGRRALRRHPVDGDQDRRPARRQDLCRRHPRRLPRQDAGLQPVALIQLGHHRHERGGDAALPRGARQARLRLQLHHLRRPPGRRPGRRGVRHAPSRKTACSPWPACSASCGWSTPPTRRPRPTSAGRAPMPASWRSPAAPPRPRRWARVRPSTSTWSRPRCRRSASRNGSSSGPATTAWTPSCGSPSGRTPPVRNCWN